MLTTDRTLGLTLGPLLLVQGLLVRQRVPRLPEAAGPRSGRDGAGRPLRLLVAGDSAAAGVGASAQSEALCGQLVQALAGDFELHWRLEAESGARTAALLARLQGLDPAGYDWVVISTGVNDVTGGVRLHRWLAQLQAIQAFFATAATPPRLIFSALPPMHAFPALPQPLRGFLGARALRFNRALRGFAEAQPHCRYLDPGFPLQPEFAAADGFHPGPRAYALWAQAVAAQIGAAATG